jgi:hypothetical protein
MPLTGFPPSSGPAPLNILTWHVHGNYLYYLTQVPHHFWIVTKPGNPPGYAHPGTGFPWGPNVHAISYEEVKDRDFDCVLFQSRGPYEQDVTAMLSPAQRDLPRVYIEHDPPQGHPTDTRHWFQEPKGMLVHVTAFNALMWDSGETPTRVIEHGVLPAEGVVYGGDTERGIVVVNHLVQRGRRLGADVFEQVRQRVPLDLIGMEAERAGGIGEVANMQVQPFVAQYRFFFNPIRYTSLGLAVIEAMMAGVPVVGLATTEMTTLIKNEVTGYVDTRIDRLVDVMQALLHNRELAREWGEAGRIEALRRFGIQRFVRDWMALFAEVTQPSLSASAVRASAVPLELAS